jgi:hypothetical protein
LAVLERLQPLADEIVLIGGQALSLWADRYAHTTELTSAAPYTSKDLDFYGQPDHGRRCADALGGTYIAYAPKDRSVCSGVVTTPEGVVIDIVHTPLGVPPSEIHRRSISFPRARLMHPLHVLMSRAANVVRIPRADPHSLGQLRAAVIVLREFTRTVLERRDLRPAHHLIEEAFKLALTEDGLAVWHRHAIDVFEAVLTVPELGPHFLEKRYPQMREKIAALRA